MLMRGAARQHRGREIAHRVVNVLAVVEQHEELAAAEVREERVASRRAPCGSTPSA